MGSWGLRWAGVAAIVGAILLSGLFTTILVSELDPLSYGHTALHTALKKWLLD